MTKRRHRPQPAHAYLLIIRKPLPLSMSRAGRHYEFAHAGRTWTPRDHHCQPRVTSLGKSLLGAQLPRAMGSGRGRRITRIRFSACVTTASEIIAHRSLAFVSFMVSAFMVWPQARRTWILSENVAAHFPGSVHGCWRVSSALSLRVEICGPVCHRGGRRQEPPADSAIRGGSSDSCTDADAVIVNSRAVSMLSNEVAGM
jgi:hypothetical protein